VSNEVSVAMPRAHGPLSRALAARAYHERIPLGGGFELTHRCNLACVHCYVNLAPDDRQAQRRELTTEQVFNVLDQITEAGTLWLTLTGGEPLLRPDFAEIYAYAHQKGLVLTVYTNATLITQRIVDLWLARPPRFVEITQYGFSPEIYDKVTDAGAQYDRFARGVERLRNAGIRIGLKTVAMRDNQHEVHAMRRWAQERGIRFRFDAILSPRIDGGKQPLAQRLTPEEIVAVEVPDEARQTSYADYCKVRVGRPPSNDQKFQCGAGVSTFVIDPYGKMHVCELTRRPGVDVLTEGFVNGFYNAFPAIRNEKRGHSDGCGSCNTHNTCSNCAGMSELEGIPSGDGNLYFCQVNDARNAAVLGEDRPRPNGLVKLRLRGEHEQRA
jgi:radical SAM protein with 4Fe4S-binding SPASM domain